MNNFSVMDDSLVFQNNIAIYTHCLINAQDQTPLYLTIKGTKNTIYDIEQIKNFIKQNLYPQNQLFLCSHYFDTYHVFEQTDFEEISRSIIKNSNNLEKRIIKLFQKADSFAREQARKVAKRI
jgi:hypothetical protein